MRVGLCVGNIIIIITRCRRQMFSPGLWRDVTWRVAARDGGGGGGRAREFDWQLRRRLGQETNQWRHTNTDERARLPNSCHVFRSRRP